MISLHGRGTGPYTIYSLATGEIMFTGIHTTPETALDEVKEGQGLIPRVLDSEQQYVNPATRRPKKRPTVTLPELGKYSVGDEILVATNVPAGTKCVVVLARQTLHNEIVDDGEISFEAEQPGYYQVLIRPPFPYQPSDVGFAVSEVKA